MGRNVILCAVSTIQPQAVVKTYQYRDEEGRAVQCSGLQTNEAPVKCLMECYRPVDVVLCLTSPSRNLCPAITGPTMPAAAWARCWNNCGKGTRCTWMSPAGAGTPCSL